MEFGLRLKDVRPVVRNLRRQRDGQIRRQREIGQIEVRGNPMVRALARKNRQLVSGRSALLGQRRQQRLVQRELGLETVGLKPGSCLEVDDSMRVKGVTGNWLYAAGDVNHRALLTHMGKYQARVCGDVIAARAEGKSEASEPAAWTKYSATADTWAVPRVVFSDPEVAAVGPTEAAAKARRINVRAVDYDIGNAVGAALYADGCKGHARMVIDQTRGVVVGMTLVGPLVGGIFEEFRG